MRRAIGWLAQAQELQKLLETFAVFGAVNGIWRSADDGHTLARQWHCQVERCLTTKLHDHPIRPFPLNDVEHILPGERLEVELVGGIVVGGHGFGVGVDHDGLHPDFTQGKGGVHAAVIKLDALADAVWPTTQDHDFFTPTGSSLVLCFVGGVIVRRVGFKFSGTGVHQFVYRRNPQLQPALAHIVFCSASELCQLHIGKTVLLGTEKTFPVQGSKTDFSNSLTAGHQLFQVIQKPGIDFGQLMQTLHLHAPAQCLKNKTDPSGVGFGKPQLKIILVHAAEIILAVKTKTHATGFKRAHTLLKSLLEGAANGHGFAHRFHGCGEDVFGFRKFFKGPARDFHHTVVNGGFKGGIGFAGDVVFQLIQGIAHCQLGRDLGNGKAGGLGGKRR